MSNGGRYDGYDENSPNALFSRILQRLDDAEKSAAASRGELKTLVEQTLVEVKKTNGRVTKLENERWFNRGVVATLSAGASALGVWLSK